MNDPNANNETIKISSISGIYKAIYHNGSYLLIWKEKMTKF